jgi:hypothetical protein
MRLPQGKHAGLTVSVEPCLIRCLAATARRSVVERATTNLSPHPLEAS